MQDSEQTLPDSLRRPGRASRSNRSGRFEPYARVQVRDGWDIAEDDAVARTHVTYENPRKILTRNQSPDISFDRSINPYRGCEHGCIYCFARPTHAYLGLSPGLDFETKLIARPKAAEALKKELSARAYTPATIAIGTNTDPYQPIEGKHRIMRSILEVLQTFQHPVTVVTKGSLVERDADILGEMGQDGLARVGISMTSLDASLSRGLEPRATAPARRLKMIERLANTGCPVRVMVAPVIPALTDHEMEGILKSAADAGATTASWIMLRLPQEVSPLFREWLEAHHPNRARRVMGHVRDMHGGQYYDAAWGRRMRGEGHYADIIRMRFERACRQFGLAREAERLRTNAFAVPGRGVQLGLFDDNG